MRLVIFFKVLHWAFKGYDIKVDVVPDDNEMLDTMVITVTDRR